MKKVILSIISIVLFCFYSIAQAPQGFNYQTVARDASGNELRVLDHMIKNQEPQDSEVTSKFYIGGGFSLVNSYNRGNLDQYWQYLNSDPAIVPGEATGYFQFNIGSISSIDLKQKNWLGFEVQLVKTASHAIWGTNTFYGGRNEVYYQALFLNVVFIYGYGLDPQNKLLLVIEPGLDLGYMSGRISATTNVYDQGFTVGLGGHIAGGINIMVSPKFGVTARFGHRMIKIDEMHKDASSETGYSSFYANGVDGETVKVDWGGSFLTLGLMVGIKGK